MAFKPNPTTSPYSSYNPMGPNPVAGQAQQLGGRPQGGQMRRPGGVQGNVVGQVNNTNVSTNNDILGLVDSLAAKQQMASGVRAQARGDQLSRTDKWTGQKSWRNALGGSIIGHRGNKRVNQAIETEAAYQDTLAAEAAAAQDALTAQEAADLKQKAVAAGQFVLSQGGSDEQALAAYEATLASLDPDKLGAFLPGGGAEIKPETKEVDRGDGTYYVTYDANNPSTVIFERKKEDATTVDDIRKLWTPEAQMFRETQDAYSRMQAAAVDPTGVGDLAILRGYIKMIEPDSRIITEDDLRGAASSGNFGTDVSVAIEKYFGEGGIGEFRDEFLNKASAMYDTSEAKYKAAYDNLSEDLRGKNANPENVLSYRPDQLLKDTPSGASPGAPGPAGTVTKQGRAEMEDGTVVDYQVIDGQYQIKDPASGEWIDAEV